MILGLEIAGAGWKWEIVAIFWNRFTGNSDKIGKLEYKKLYWNFRKFVPQKSKIFENFTIGL